MKYLITPSLLNAFLYFENDTRENASEEFLNTLNKEFKTNELIEKGIKYENDLVNKIIIDEFSSIIENGLFQVKMSKNISINDNDFVLYAIADVVKENYIYDIKRTGNYHYMKYFNSMQHRIEMFCSGILNFKYLINDNDKERYIEEYQYTINTYYEIIECINRLMNTINSYEDFRIAFNKNFISKY